MRRRHGRRRPASRPRGGGDGEDADARAPRRLSRRTGRRPGADSPAHLHEPRGARDARTGGEGRRSRRVVHLEWNVPLDLRPLPAAIRVVPRLQAGLPDSGRGRPEETDRRHHPHERERPEGLPEEGDRGEDDLRGGERAEARRLHRVPLADEGGGGRAGGDCEDCRDLRRSEDGTRRDGLRRPDHERASSSQGEGEHPRTPAGAFPLRARGRVSGYERHSGGVHRHSRGEAPQHHGRRRRLPVHLHVARGADREHHGVPEPLAGMHDRQARTQLPLRAGRA